MLIVQITDTHITRDGEEARYLSDAIVWINAMHPQPAAILVSGDVVNDGQLAQYTILRDLLGRCEAPVFVVPGNHDRRATLRATLSPAYFPGVIGERLHYALDMHPVRIIGLDTAHDSWGGGYLDNASLTWLNATLEAQPAHPTLLFMHHPPFRTGVNAADMLGFKGVTRFRRIVARHGAVRRIIAGHVHCERHTHIAQALATTSISSAPQRVPELFERHILGLRPEPAGIATHVWSDDGFTSTTYINAGDGRFVVRA